MFSDVLVNLASVNLELVWPFSDLTDTKVVFVSQLLDISLSGHSRESLEMIVGENVSVCYQLVKYSGQPIWPQEPCSVAWFDFQQLRTMCHELNGPLLIRGIHKATTDEKSQQKKNVFDKVGFESLRAKNDTARFKVTKKSDFN